MNLAYLGAMPRSWQVSGLGYQAQSLRTVGWKSSWRRCFTAEGVKRGKGSEMPIWEGAVEVMEMGNWKEERSWIALGGWKQRCLSGLKGGNADEEVDGTAEGVGRGAVSGSCNDE